MTSDPRPTSNYDSVADHYDATRDMPGNLLTTLLERVEAITGLAVPADVLDAGCGTGQLSLPLADHGHRVVGIDISDRMLEVARGKVSTAIQIEFHNADVRALPFSDHQFDAVVVSKLFQHVGGWTDAVDELRRVTRRGGLFLHINEKGAFKNAVRSRFSALAKERSFGPSYPGFIDRTELPRYLESSGATRVEVPTSDLDWPKLITYKAALEHLELRLHSEFWGIPDAQYSELLELTQQWIDEQPDGANTVEEMAPYLTAEIYQWPF